VPKLPPPPAHAQLDLVAATLDVRDDRPAEAWSFTKCGKWLGSRRRFLAEDDEAVQDVYAEREDRQRPPRVRSADR
jgi:hypothetical protein